MDDKQLTTEIEKAAEAGETMTALAKRLGLTICADYSDYEGRIEPGPAILMPGYYADDGNCEVYYPEAESGEEAARDYVDEGDWRCPGDVNETFWLSISTYRRGYAVAIDEDDEDDEPEVVWVQADEDSHTIEVDPEEPDCEEDHEHDWRSPYSVLGGLKENPGVWGNGGGVVIREVCRHCGRYKVTDTWAQGPSGEQGLTSIEYREADEVSAEWVAKQTEQGDEE